MIYDTEAQTSFSAHKSIKSHGSPAANDEVSDEQYMAAVIARDEAALASLYHRHKYLLRTIISRILSSDSESDDLLQEVFIEIWNQAPRFDPSKGKALGWIVTLARRRSIDKLRRKQASLRGEERLRLETDATSQAPSHIAADQEAVANDHMNILQRILKSLPDAQRDVLHLNFYHGLSHREIAAKTGIPLGTIKTRLDLALCKVRKSVLALGGMQAWSLNQY